MDYQSYDNYLQNYQIYKIN